jgi:hypothetical protein
MVAVLAGLAENTGLKGIYIRNRIRPETNNISHSLDQYASKKYLHTLGLAECRLGEENREPEISSAAEGLSRPHTQNALPPQCGRFNSSPYGPVWQEALRATDV